MVLHFPQIIAMQSTARSFRKRLDERLLAVALDIDVVKFKSLTLTCCRLRPIVREAMLRSAPPVVMSAIGLLLGEL